MAVPRLLATQDVCSAWRTTDTFRTHVHNVPVTVQNLQLCHVVIIPIHFLPTHEFGKPLAEVSKHNFFLYFPIPPRACNRGD